MSFVGAKVNRRVLTAYVVAALGVVCLPTSRAAEPSVQSEIRRLNDDMIRIATELIDGDSADATWLVRRAAARRRGGDEIGARFDLNEAHKLDPYLADVEEAVWYLSDGDVSRAEAMLDEAINDAPGRFEAHYHRSLVHLRRRFYSRALSEIEQALELAEPLSTEFGDAALRQAEINHSLGRYREAVDAITQAIDRHFVAAVEHAKQGITPRSLNARYYERRADALFELHEFHRALDDLTTCEAAGIRTPNLYEYRAECYRALGDFDAEKRSRARAAQLQAEANSNAKQDTRGASPVTR